jgi:anaerobic selenocysteine-containing dehydrogenase
MAIAQGEMRYEKYRENGFTTSSGKFELYSSALEAMGLSPLPIYREPALSPASSFELSHEYPFILTTGAKNRFFFTARGARSHI